ncbi:TRAP transporter substrate-binding protein [Luteimonas suaedae]|uniref:TRAP transporter substrate-binding protein n=1 Tax=Luteimonas suaedae TaxID=2605430 RepID=UPI001CA9206E|nr:TRAP transporter substrate-binding protein [Luteimonas suaedae]
MLTRRELLLTPLLLMACQRRKTGSSQRPLFAAETHPESYPTTRALHAIDRVLAERTGGEMRVRVYSGGQLGSEADTLEITIFGGLDLNRVNLAPVNSIVPETMVLALPFLFRSVAHSRAAFDGAPGRAILDAMTPHGLKGLCYYDSGARSFYNTRRPIRTPDDMRGLKVRVQNSSIYVAMVQALGANPTPIPYTEVFQALVQGVVDGAENNWPSYESSRHFEAARHYSMTNHVLAPEVLVASMHTWKKLDDAQREHLQAAVDGSVPIMRELWDARVEESRRRVLEDGIELVEDVDHDAFASRMRPVWDRFLTTPRLRELADRIQALDAPAPAEARQASDASRVNRQ